MENPKGYGRIYQSIMRDPDITIEAKAVYGYLAALAGADVSCYPSVEIMQRELAIGKNRLQRCIRELTSKGIIAVRQERSGNRYGKNIYELCHSQGLRFEATENEATENEATEQTLEITQERHFEATEFQSPQNEAHTSNSINNIYESVLESYNRICTSYAEAGLTKEIRRNIDALLEKGLSIDDFEDAFRMAEESSFLQGKNKRGWKADLSWILKDDHMERVLGGKYRDYEQENRAAEVARPYRPKIGVTSS